MTCPILLAWSASSLQRKRRIVTAPLSVVHDASAALSLADLSGFLYKLPFNFGLQWVSKDISLWELPLGKDLNWTGPSYPDLCIHRSFPTISGWSPSLVFTPSLPVANPSPKSWLCLTAAQDSQFRLPD